jgi:D-alanine-D-alanine ligase
LENQLHITVLLGGPGEEREVSLRSGKAVIEALQSLGHRVDEVDPRAADWRLGPGTEVVFLALHGEYGEDGQVQARLEADGVPYTGTGVRGSELAFDKELTKNIFAEKGIPTPRWLMVNSIGSPAPVGLPAPWVLKPVRQGSSVGLQLVDDASQWESALAAAGEHGGKILCEECVEGREITVGILDGKALPIVEIQPRKGAFDYHNKYTVGATDFVCPADFSAERTEAIARLGVEAFEAVEGRDFGRVDMMLDTDLNPFVLEVNTLPGLTQNSLLPRAAAAAGIDFPALCGRMVELAVKRN